MKYLKHITFRRVVTLKGVIAVGLMAAHFLPAEAAVVVSMSANLVWLYKF